MSLPYRGKIRDRVSVASQRRREGHRGQVRHAILAAAGAVFLEVGLEALSMRKVAERAGYTATTLYRYFTDKDDLVFAMTSEGLVAFTAALREGRDAGNDPLSQIEGLGVAYVRFGLDHPALYRLLFIQRPDFLGRSRGDIQTLRVESFSLLRETVSHAMGTGAATPGDAAAVSMSLWAVVHGVASLAITMPGVSRAQADQMAVQAVGWCIRGIRE
ncbi:MAG TPA: TetR/AcrR family transcriptional regulator [Gemmatimonadales bacterium]